MKKKVKYNFAIGDSVCVAFDEYGDEMVTVDKMTVSRYGSESILKGKILSINKDEVKVKWDKDTFLGDETEIVELKFLVPEKEFKELYVDLESKFEEL